MCKQRDILGVQNTEVFRHVTDLLQNLFSSTASTSNN